MPTAQFVPIKVSNKKKVSPKLAGSILKCYLEMDQPHTASTLAKGLVDSNPDLSEELKVIELESAWQLGQWSRIETEVKASTTNSKAEPTHCQVTIMAVEIDQFQIHAAVVFLSLAESNIRHKPLPFEDRLGGLLVSAHSSRCKSRFNPAKAIV